MKQQSLRPSKNRKLSLRDTPTVHFQKENSSNFSNLVSHRFEEDNRFSLKNHNKQTVLNSVPLINSISMTPKPQSPPSETTLDDLFIKMDNYLLMTNVLIEEAESACTSSDSLIKETKKLRECLIVNLEQIKSNRVKNGLSTKKQPQNDKLIMRIRNLEIQNSNLSEMVSKQEQANLKLILQMNDSQLNGIEHWKQKLQKAYKQYKNLEERVQGYQSQLQQMKNIKELIQQDNQNKSRTIECLQQKIRRSSLRPKEINEMKEYHEGREEKGVRQGRETLEGRASSKNRGFKNESMSFQVLKERIKNDILMPPFKSNIRKLPYTSPFEEDYLRCIRNHQDPQSSLENFISE